MKPNRKFLARLAVLVLGLILVVAAFACYIRYSRTQTIKELGTICDALQIRGVVPVTIIPTLTNYSAALYPVEQMVSNRETIQKLFDLFSDQIRAHRIRSWNQGETIGSKSELSFEFVKAGKPIGKLTIISSDVLFFNRNQYVESSDDLLRTAIELIGL